MAGVTSMPTSLPLMRLYCTVPVKFAMPVAAPSMWLAVSSDVPPTMPLPVTPTVPPRTCWRWNCAPTDWMPVVLPTSSLTPDPATKPRPAISPPTLVRMPTVLSRMMLSASAAAAS